MDNNNLLDGQSTELEQVVDNEAPAGAVTQHTIPGTPHKFYLGKPDRGVLSRVYSLIIPTGLKEVDPVRAGEIILNSCWVGGDEEIKQDDQLYVAACIGCLQVIGDKVSVVKKIVRTNTSTPSST